MENEERERGRNDVARWGAVKNWHLFTPSPFLAFFFPSFQPTFPKWLFLGAPVTNINAHLWKYTQPGPVSPSLMSLARDEKKGKRDGRKSVNRKLSLEVVFYTWHLVTFHLTVSQLSMLNFNAEFLTVPLFTLLLEDFTSSHSYITWLKCHAYIFPAAQFISLPLSLYSFPFLSLYSFPFLSLSTHFPFYFMSASTSLKSVRQVEMCHSL